MKVIVDKHWYTCSTYGTHDNSNLHSRAVRPISIMYTKNTITFKVITSCFAWIDSM